MSQPKTSSPCLNPELIHRYNVSGPRYTSYPTALQFTDFDEQKLLRAIQESDLKERDLSLYFHIPFCSTLCYYCACNKIVTRKRELATNYLNLLSKEIALQAPRFVTRKVSQLHWGGGTPTFLDDDEISGLMNTIRDRFEIRSDEDGEFSIEIDPRTVNPVRIRGLRECGFNRLSLGIQDFDKKVQAAVNRKQSFSQTKQVIEAAKRSGFKSISVDLIYGLPHQSTQSFLKTLQQVVNLNPDRISIYNYAHLPERFQPQQRILTADLPNADEKLNILQLCIEELTSEGYQNIGMDHFAKPDDALCLAQQNGTLQRNFQGYSTQADCDLIAFGITGISHIGTTFSQNVKQLEEYQRLLEAHKLPVEKGIVLSKDDLIRQAVIKALICQFNLRFVDIEETFCIEFATYFAKEMVALRPLAQDGLCSINQQGVKVSNSGRLLIRNLCMVFDKYLHKPKTTTRYSRAI
ncbi:MAG: oxygen-independent coproporphyrinogen III oxidase [Gammaproteobacteria bacterium]|jgi:oxygen-independent coproporphyrinogen III oxidase|nr:oxygen-independent coproporphyrinogen III oxidase [Gammaproteobacteria bacterium]